MKRRTLLQALAAGTLSAAWPVPGMAGAKTARRQLRLPLTVRNPLAEPLKDQVLFVYAPLSSAVQRVSALQVDAAHRVDVDALGNSVVAVSFEELPPFATRVVTLSAVVELEQVAISERADKEGRWLGDEPFIEAGDAEIRTLAATLRRETPLATARAIHDWLTVNVAYAGFVAADLGAREALRARRADCTEYAYLAAALARCNDIPARVLGGYTATSDFVPYADAYHNWAEVYADGAWRLLDAQRGRFDVGYAEYVAFCRRSSRIENALRGAHRFRVEGEIRVSLPG